MADVYDFRTGRLCKRCERCGYWKDAEVDFHPGVSVKICKECAAMVLHTEIEELEDITA